MMSDFNNFATNPLGTNLINQTGTTQVDRTRTLSRHASNTRALQSIPRVYGVVKQYMDNRKYDNCIIINNIYVQNNSINSRQAPLYGSRSEERTSVSRRLTHNSNGTSTSRLPNTSTSRTGQTQTVTLSQRTSSRNQSQLPVSRHSTLSNTHTISTRGYTTRVYESANLTTRNNTSAVRTISSASNNTTRAVRGTVPPATTHRRR